MSKGKKLTPEQEETRMHGLRILARLIARRHLELTRGESDKASGVVAEEPSQSMPASEEFDD